jgi:hypothetical protein
MITMDASGSTERTEQFLKRMASGEIFRTLGRYGQEGVRALSSATPEDTGETASSWTYELEATPSTYAIIWSNTNVVNGRPIAILLQYGHGTGTGGYVQGRDYINPALRPIFDRIVNEAWKEVTK